MVHLRYNNAKESFMLKLKELRLKKGYTAKEMAEMYYMNQVAAETPDVREDKIAEIREKLKDPSYLNNAVIASAAEHIMESFGI